MQSLTIYPRGRTVTSQNFKFRVCHGLPRTARQCHQRKQSNNHPTCTIIQAIPFPSSRALDAVYFASLPPIAALHRLAPVSASRREDHHHLAIQESFSSAINQ